MTACSVQTLWECALVSEVTSSVVVTFGSCLFIPCEAALLLLLS